jgi:hypothetical protein
MATLPADHQPFLPINDTSTASTSPGGTSSGATATFSTPRYRGSSAVAAQSSTGSPNNAANGRTIARGSSIGYNNTSLHVQTSGFAMNNNNNNNSYTANNGNGQGGQSSNTANDLDAYGGDEEGTAPIDEPLETTLVSFPCCGARCGRLCCCGARCMFIQQSCCGCLHRIWRAIIHLDWLLVFTIFSAGVMALIQWLAFEHITWYPNPAWKWPTMYIACCVFYQVIISYPIISYHSLSAYYSYAYHMACIDR